MQGAGTELHLVLDDALRGGAAVPTAAPRVLKTVRISDSVSYLRSGSSPEALVASSGSNGDLMVEPLPAGPHPRLLLLTPQGAATPTVNGRSAPRVCLLRVGDQLLMEDGRLLHVTAYSTPMIGPATEQQVGSRCPVCLTPIKQDARVFTCPCGSVTHYDDAAGTPADERLECATIPSECLLCRHPIHLKGGYIHVPDFG